MYLPSAVCATVRINEWEKYLVHYREPARSRFVKLLARYRGADFGQLVAVLRLYVSDPLNTIADCQATDIHGIHDLLVRFVATELAIEIRVKGIP